MSIKSLDKIVCAQKRGQSRGINSICSSHPFVLRAGLYRSARASTSVLVETACNQVNQFGGYTGMTPMGMIP